MSEEQKETIPHIHFKPLTLAYWPDLEQLFGARGACGGCWCMFWRLPRAQFEQQKGEGNRKALHKLVASGQAPGLLAYDDARPVGWCAVAPRAHYSGLARSRILKPLDEQPVWSISCFFIHKDYRRQGISVALLEAVKQYVNTQGGRILEAYPVEPTQGFIPAAFAWTGLASAFKKAGFKECARRSATRPIMRFYCQND